LRAFRQGWAAAADFEIVEPSRRGVRGADDAAHFRDDDLGLDGMALLLAGVPASLLAVGPLDRLFGAVDNQGLGFLAADADASF